MSSVLQENNSITHFILQFLSLWELNHPDTFGFLHVKSVSKVSHDLCTSSVVSLVGLIVTAPLMMNVHEDHATISRDSS